ncbi:MAG: GlsB/YeaQ/YmgE family stress response membrane protein [Planctomycetota bacterium]
MLELDWGSSQGCSSAASSAEAVNHSHGGCLSGIAVGFVGALLGTWIARAFGLPEIFMLTIGGVAMPIVWSIIGATLFVALVSMLAGPRRRTA